MNLRPPLVGRAGNQQVEVFHAAADVANRKGTLRVWIVHEVQFQLSDSVWSRFSEAAAAGEGVSRPVKVQQECPVELLTAGHSGRGELALPVGGQLEGGD
jgi:hypothetical protein